MLQGKSQSDENYNFITIKYHNQMNNIISNVWFSTPVQKVSELLTSLRRYPDIELNMSQFIYVCQKYHLGVWDKTTQSVISPTEWIKTAEKEKVAIHTYGISTGNYKTSPSAYCVPLKA